MNLSKVRIFVVALLVILSLTSIASTTQAQAAYIARDALIHAVGNTSYELPVFVVKVSGGTGACGNSTITFPESTLPDPNNPAYIRLYERAYSTALTAFAAGKRVDIYNYDGSDCDNASFIEVKQ